MKHWIIIPNGRLQKGMMIWPKENVDTADYRWEYNKTYNYGRVLLLDKDEDRIAFKLRFGI